MVLSAMFSAQSLLLVLHWEHTEFCPVVALTSKMVSFTFNILEFEFEFIYIP
jgi:hypothetical protein